MVSLRDTFYKISKLIDSLPFSLIHECRISQRLLSYGVFENFLVFGGQSLAQQKLFPVKKLTTPSEAHFWLNRIVKPNQNTKLC